MADTPRGDAGTVVTYLDTSDPDARGLRRGVVAGVGVSDPDTDAIWVPIVRPDCELTLVDPELIMDLDPNRADESEDTSGAIEVLAGALTILAMELHELDETEPLALHIAQNLLSRFVGAIRPVEHALESLVEADPSGTLAIVLTCIGSAAAEFEHGHVTFGKMDVLVANAAMAELIE